MEKEIFWHSLHSEQFVRVFKRNCPYLRLHIDEENELVRLFTEAQKDAVETAIYNYKKNEERK